MGVKVDEGKSAGRRWQMYQTRLGADVYNALTLTSLARSAVNDLVSITVSDALVEGEESLPVSLDSLGRRLVFQGSIVIDSRASPAQFIDDVFVPSPDRFLQYLRSSNGAMSLIVPGDNMNNVYTKLTREFKLEAGVWRERLIENLGDAKTRREVEPAGDDGLAEIPEGEGLVVFANGRGLLYWAQHTYNALEEIAATMRSVMTGINLLPIISGNVGNAEEARQAIESAINAIVFPGDVSVDRVISNAVINQLIDEAHERRGDFYDALGVVEKDTPDRPVAADREQRSKAMLALVRSLRSKITEIMRRLGRVVTFEPYVAKSGVERLGELDILERVKQELTAEEYSQRARALIGLGPRPAGR